MHDSYNAPCPRRALCLAFAPLLLRLSLCTLDPDVGAAVARHVASCDYCQRQMRGLDRLREALRREEARGSQAAGGALALSVADADGAADLEEAEPLIVDTPAPLQERSSAPRHRRRRGVLSVIEALTALLVVASLSGAFTGPHPVGQVPAQTVSRLIPTAIKDPVSQIYVLMLRSYYVPLAHAPIAVRECCQGSLAASSLTASPSIAVCRSALQVELATSQALRAHLASATPQARWQTQHATLWQAVQAIIDIENTSWQSSPRMTWHALWPYKTRRLAASRSAAIPSARSALVRPRSCRRSSSYHPGSVAAVRRQHVI
jgi:hypothetical protein